MAKRRNSEAKEGTNLILNEEAIKKRRIVTASSPSETKPWMCKFCNRPLYSEDSFMKHTCQKMLRAKELGSFVGQRAFALYSYWLKKKNNQTVEISTFATSQYYNAFIKFSEFVSKVKIAHTNAYIDLMLEANVAPYFWCAEINYKIYSDWVFDIMEPNEVLLKSLEYLNRMCEISGKKPQELLAFIGPAGIINAIRMKSIAPWVLLKLKTFHAVYEIFDDGERTALENLINVDQVQNIVENHSDVLVALDEYCACTGF